MLLKYVQHHLNDTGMNYFPQWFSMTKAEMQKIDGFLTVHFSFDKIDPNKIHFFIMFDDEKGLQNWADSDVHKQVLKELERFWTKPFIAQQLELSSA